MSLKHHAAIDKDRWYWKGACLAVLEAYRKLPHTSTGECPLFLATGQDPSYAIDHLLPTVPQEIWQQGGAAANLDQLTYALAQCNTVMVQLCNKDLTLPWDSNVKPGDRVYKQNMRMNKLDPRWLTGYQVVHMEMSCTVVLRHDASNREEFVNVRHIRKASLVSELLQHMGTVPKLYLRLEDLPDLNWPAIMSALEEAERQMAEDVASGEMKTTTQTQSSQRDVPPEGEMKAGML